jgi:Fe-S cluster assembly protein SufD
LPKSKKKVTKDYKMEQIWIFDNGSVRSFPAAPGLAVASGEASAAASGLAVASDEASAAASGLAVAPASAATVVSADNIASGVGLDSADSGACDVLAPDSTRPASAASGAQFPQEIYLSEGEQLAWTFLILPGAPSLPPLKVVLQGEHSDFSLNVLCLAGEKDRQTIEIEVVHATPNASSSQLVRCIATGDSRVNFDGRIRVMPDAQKTQAYQSSHALLLSEKAKISALPQLEIYADDVKCSHGASSGSLDENEQFYMRSRGLTLEQARLLQLHSFAWPVLQTVQNETVREEMVARVDEVLTTFFV